MCRKINLCCFIFLSLLSCNFIKVHAADRVVLSSIPSDVWHQNIYLIADKVSWVEYRNFTVQIGDMGQYVYNFPNCYHGKYDPSLYKEDINSDALEDIIIVLNNEIAGQSSPVKDIHILNQIHDPYRRYEEAPVEPIQSIVKQHIKIEKQGNNVIVFADKKKYKIDVSKFKYTNPLEPYTDTWSVEYSIIDEKLIAAIYLWVVSDDSVYGGLIGNFDIEYYWDGKAYKANRITFKEELPGKS
jgi:hypothetical protein